MRRNFHGISYCEIAEASVDQRHQAHFILAWVQCYIRKIPRPHPQDAGNYPIPKPVFPVLGLGLQIPCHCVLKAPHSPVDPD